MNEFDIDYSIIIVNYNTRDMLNGCLLSISRIDSGATYEVIVVDNNSTDGSIEMMQSKYNDIKVIGNAENKGFAEACNQGMRVSRGRQMILLNSDTEVLPNTINQINNYLKDNCVGSKIGVLGCKILNSDGTLQYSTGIFPSIGSTIIDMFKQRQKRKYILTGYDTPHEVDWVTGAIMVINRRLIEEIGFFDERYFMYYEEVDFCLKAKNRGWKVIYFPGASIIHKNPYAYRQSGISEKIQTEIRKSHLYYYRKNHCYFSFLILSIATIIAISLNLWCLRLVGGQKKVSSKRILKEVWKTIRKLNSKSIIYINARFLTQSITGVQRYAIELVKALDELISVGVIDNRRYSFVLLAPKDIKYELGLKNIPLLRVGYFSGHLWEQFNLPYHTGPGLLMNWCNVAPLIKRNQVVTIHDASVFAAPKSYSFTFRLWYKALLNICGIMSRMIITVSLFSKKELLRYCHISESKINVIYEGKEHILCSDVDENVLKRNNIGQRPFILAVSSLNYNKNHQSVINAITMLGAVDFDIIFVGSTNPKVFRYFTTNMIGNIKFLGYVTDEELKALYIKATCFIYPSFYEGFGLPPLEAMACGCPVIVSNAASLPEVCGDAALYCDPHSVEDIAEKIKIMVTNAALRNEFSQKGLERAKQFTWERCTRETISIIEKVLDS